MEKSNKYKLWVIVTAVAAFFCLGMVLYALTEGNTGQTDHDWATILEPPDYSYSIVNYSASISLTLTVNGTEIPIDVLMEVKEYFVSVDQISEDSYRLYISIKGLYINASIGTPDGLMGATLVCDEFQFTDTIDECTPEAIQEALMGVLTIEQWSMEA